MTRLTFRDWLAIFIIAAFTLSLFFLLATDFPKQNEQLITYMLGQLSGFANTALALYYVVSKNDDQRAKDAGNIAAAAKDIASVARNATTGPTGEADDPVHTVENDK